MSKKKKRRTVSLGSIPGATPTEEPAEQPTQPDAAPSSPPARQRTAAARTTARPTRASNTTSELQLDPTKRRNYFVRWFDALNDFWFAPRSPRMLGVIRILTGVLLLYSLAVWTLELTTFFSTEGLLPQSYRGSNELWFAWSHLDWFASSSTMLMVAHCVGMLVVLLFTAGIQTRVTSILTAVIAIGYCNRSIGADFGLDQILAFLCMYCAIGNSGGAYSVDRMLAYGKSVPAPPARTTTNIAIRLIQIHLCIVYFFACLLYTSPSPRDRTRSRMPSSA